MKILLVSTFFHPSVGGVERQVEEIAYHLRQKEMDVGVLTTDASHGQQGRMTRKSEVYRDIPIKRFRYLFGFGNFFRFSPGLVWTLLMGRYDVLHIHNVHDAHLIPALIIKTLRRKRLVLTGHNPFVVSSEKRGERLHSYVGFYERTLRLFAGRVDAYIALLESEKEEVIQRFQFKEHKVYVIPNGIQDIFYQQGGNSLKFQEEWGINRSKWDLVVGGVGRINYVKGFQNLKTAVDDLKHVLFVFAGGDDGYLNKLKVLYRDNDNVLFIPQYLPSDEVRDFYQSIDIFLLPSIYEPFGMTLVEAMAQGKMVIATNKGGPVELVNDKFGELLDPSDEQAWKERINYYSMHREETVTKGLTAKNYATRYQWKNIVKKLLEVYS